MSASPPTRDQVETRWLALLSGDLSREEVHVWTVPYVEGDAEPADPIAFMGVTTLHGLDLAAGSSGQPEHGWAPGRTYVHSDLAIAKQLEEWREHAASHDRDPASWQLGQLRQALRTVRAEEGVHQAHEIGMRLVRRGVLTPRQLQEILND